MFGLGAQELMLILLIALVLFGGVETSDAGSEPKDTSSNHKDAGSTR